MMDDKARNTIFEQARSVFISLTGSLDDDGPGHVGLDDVGLDESLVALVDGGHDDLLHGVRHRTFSVSLFEVQKKV